jgi:hypothetical protein
MSFVYLSWKGWELGFTEPAHLSPASAGLPVYPDAYNFTSGILSRTSFRGGGSLEQRFLYDVPDGRADEILAFYERRLLPLGWKPVGEVIHEGPLNSLQNFRQIDKDRLMEIRVFTSKTSPHVAKVLINFPYTAWKR